MWDISEFYANSWELSSRYLKVFANIPKSGGKNLESRIHMVSNISD